MEAMMPPTMQRENKTISSMLFPFLFSCQDEEHETREEQNSYGHYPYIDKRPCLKIHLHETRNNETCEN